MRESSLAARNEAFSFCDVQVLLGFLFAVRKLFAPLPKCDLELYQSFLAAAVAAAPLETLLELFWICFGFVLELDLFCPPPHFFFCLTPVE